MNDGGSSFNERTCLMTTASHNVAALSPEAFAAPPKKSSLFPCAPGYSRNSVPPLQNSRQAVRRACALLRGFTLAPLHCFVGQRGRVFTDSPLLSNPYTIQLSTYYRPILSQPVKSGNAPAGARFSSPASKTGAFKPVVCKKSRDPPDTSIPDISKMHLSKNTENEELPTD
jgi:hypothetical protein